MDDNEGRLFWWSQSSLRISHPNLDPLKTAQDFEATPSIAQQPGQSKVQHGECKSAGYLCISHRADEPDRPNVVIQWAEDFVSERQAHFFDLLDRGCHVDVYVGVHTDVLALGFTLPPTPTLWELGIEVGIEFFSS